MKNLVKISLLSLFLFLGACSEARYAAHVVKQIPLPGDREEPTGYFKVGNGYTIKGRRYYPKETYNYTQTGVASWYGPGFHGKLTANGEIFDENEMTAAHKTLQMPSIVRVTNLSNGRTAILRVNDRGPFAHDRIIDVSKRAASVLGFKSKGTAKVRMEVLSGPSKEVASRSKAGYSTKGYEVALANSDGRITPSESTVVQRVAMNPTIQTSPVKPLPQAAIADANSNYVPTPPLRKPMAVEAVSLRDTPIPPAIPTGNIYVQTAAFSQEASALAYSSKMASFGPSKVYFAQSNGKPIYRVRLGPYEDRIAASQVKNILQQNGNNNAVIVSD